jgi:hypothetical protein
MKLSSLFLPALLAGVGLFSCQDHWATKSASADVYPAATRPTVGPLLGVGTVLTSHSFPLAQHRHGPIKHLYVEGGQHVRKGELLLKYYDYTFLMAPAAGIITQYADTPHTPNSGAEPVFFFTEVTPFRLRLSTNSARDTLAVGQRILVESTQHPAQVVTGTLLAIHTDSASLLLELRLLTTGREPLPIQSQVRVTRLLGPVKGSVRIGGDK